MFDPTQPAQQTRPTTTSVARPNKKCRTAHNWAEAPYWAQCYSLNNWISHWCKFWVFIGQFWCKIHWIVGAGYECNFIWFLRVILFLYIERIQHRPTQQWCDWWEFKGANLPPDKINAETEPHFAYISVFSTFLVFSNLLWFCVFQKFLDWYFTMISGFSI